MKDDEAVNRGRHGGVFTDDFQDLASIGRRIDSILLKVDGVEKKLDSGLFKSAAVHLGLLLAEVGVSIAVEINGLWGSVIAQRNVSEDIEMRLIEIREALDRMPAGGES